MTNIKHVAWMGGSRPRPVTEISEEEWAYVKKLMVDQMDEWRAFWQETEVPRDVKDTFFGRARYDAHATFRDNQK